MTTIYEVAKSNEWKKYFPEKGIDKSTTLTLTEQGMYSITKPMEANQIIDIISKYAPPTAIILDGTAGCGGDTISFASYFKYVISVEIDKNNCLCMKNNIAAYNLDQKVKVVCPNNLMEVIENEEIKYDIIFLDPPWGGKNYRQEKGLNIYLCRTLNLDTISDDKCAEKIISQEIANQVPNKLFVMKVPTNFNFTEFKNEISKERAVHKYPIFKYFYELKRTSLISTKTKHISFYLLVCEPVKKLTQPDEDDDSDDLIGGYYNKYRKYKLKYLALKGGTTAKKFNPFEQKSKWKS